MNEKLDIDVKTLKPFTKFIYTIGELPTSYLMSMTYEEQLIWLCNYLTQTVIPTINNNAEAVEEVQNLVIELQEYINNYFDNLDVQEEINNKLDEMILDGTFDSIINQTLFTQINNDITALENNVGDLTQLKTAKKSSIVASINNVVTRKYVLIGDSYLGGYDGQSTGHSWGYYFKQYNGISDSDCYIFYESGAGFVRHGSTHDWNFLGLIQAKISEISDPNEITDFIIAGGTNDGSYDIANITTHMASCLNYVKTNFPNARIYVGLIGYKNGASQYNNRQAIMNKVYTVYKKCGDYGARYLTGLELISHDFSNFGYDDTHLSETGYAKIGAGLMQAMDGCYTYAGEFNYTTLTPGGMLLNGTKTIPLTENFKGDFKILQIEEFNLNDFDQFTISGYIIDLVTATEMQTKLHYFQNTYANIPSVYCMMEIKFTDNTLDGYYGGILRIDSQTGKLQFFTDSRINNKTIVSIRNREPLAIVIPALMN